LRYYPSPAQPYSCLPAPTAHKGASNQGRAGKGKSLGAVTPHLRSPVLACVFEQLTREQVSASTRACARGEIPCELQPLTCTAPGHQCALSLASHLPQQAHGRERFLQYGLELELTITWHCNTQRRSRATLPALAARTQQPETRRAKGIRWRALRRRLRTIETTYCISARHAQQSRTKATGVCFRLY
jgi:hypothetical protein